MIAELSTRKVFNSSDKGWSKYVDWIELPFLEEVRSLDSYLNNYVDQCGDFSIELSQLEQYLKLLPVAKVPSEYYQLKIMLSNTDTVPAVAGFRFLGIDLSDETHTSSILNCGPWDGSLKQYAKKLNRYGLLDLPTAIEVQRILPDEWQEDPHSFVDLWAIYEKE